jgi:hypothetical protein
MPRRKSPPRLYLDPKRKQWVVRDGSHFIRTGFGERNRKDAEKALAEFLANKHRPVPTDQPLIADVLNVYGIEVAPHKKSAKNIGYAIANLLKWWGAKTVADISTKSCRTYAAGRPSMAAMSDLKVLKAAVTHGIRISINFPCRAFGCQREIPQKSVG